MLALNFSVRAQTFNPHYTGPYAKVEGKFFIRLYVVYCQISTDTWADNLGAIELQRRTARTFAMLNAAFNQHEIYFVPGEPEQGECLEVFTQYNQEPLPEYSDGLTMHVFSDDNQNAPQATGNVYANTIPARKFWVRGKEGADPGSNLPVVIHEVGHCLGLAHTFAFTTSNNNYDGPSASCTSSGNCDTGFGSDPDQCCGDMVGDTPKHGISTSIVISGDCQTSTTPTGISPAIFKNYMSYSYPTRCRDHFSDQQVLRMRKYLKNASILAPMLVDPEVIATGTPVTWSTPTSKFTNIEVPSGATLIINDVLEMAPGTYIIVRRGGTLIVNAAITAGCGDMWSGVVVEGNGNFPQKETNGQPSSNQGRLVLNTDGVLEHAQTGIGVYDFENPDDADDGGGIIEVFGRIRNCTKGIQFERYRNANTPNASIVSGAFLTLDGNYRGTTAAQPEFLHLREINRLDIWGTWFYDNRTQNCTGRTSRAKGLVADDAAFRLRSSLFRNLDRGILSDPLKSGAYGAYDVQNSTFINCYTGIESNLPDPFSITGNYFGIGRPPVCPVVTAANEPFVGMQMHGYALPQGITLTENEFQPEDSDEDETLIGTDCSGAGSMENYIRKNTYRDLNFANRASGNNGGPTGLRYECNENYDNIQADFLVTANGSVRGIQGDINSDLQSSTAAGNRFSDVGYTWFNDGAPVTYYYWENIPEQDPNLGAMFTGIIIKEATVPNPNCSTGVQECPPPCELEETETWKDQFFQEKTDWLSKTAQYDNLTDTSAQAALLREIMAHRSAMDIWGGRVLRDFALDSTGTKSDSVLVWMEHLHTYEADLRLARHAFFTGDSIGYAQGLNDIPIRHNLTEVQEDELTDFADMLEVVRPHTDTAGYCRRLPKTALDSLEQWASNCNEPGFIARVLLLRNGRETVSNCGDTSAQRPVPAPTLSNAYVAVAGLRIFPNPTKELLFVELPQSSSLVNISLYALDGRVVLERTVTSSTIVDCSRLPQGIYVCHVMDQYGIPRVAKVVISH